MPNKSSNAGHIPIRTCVVCRKKSAQDELFAFLLMPSGIVYDLCKKLNARKHYVCREAECVQSLVKWRKKRAKGRTAR